MRSTGPVGVYPGSFNPLTNAHLAIAAAARDQHRLVRVELVISRIALGKEDLERPRLEDRFAVVRSEADRHDWLDARITEDRLIADIARGYDLVIMGADKWVQLIDPGWYGGVEARDEALARLPTLAIAPRPPNEVPPELLLEMPPEVVSVSSTAARTGRRDLMAPAAALFDEATGAWTDPARYERWLDDQL